jgi:8-oxo-dGTP diphosphatase
MIEAAGGVIWRAGVRDRMEILLIHRPRYHDWSLPKGKLKSGESHLECALREVREETGLRCRVGPELPEARYVDRKSRDKLVKYWAMQAFGGHFRRNAEVDRVWWVAEDDAPTLLTYDHDVTVIAGLHVVMALGA